MKAGEIKKLLGGYATGTLTETERRVLFEAALRQQKLFNALADEEALRELLSDEAFCEELIEILGEEAPALPERSPAWWRRPLPLAVAGGLAAASVAVVIVHQASKPTAPVQEIAMQRESLAMKPLLEAGEAPLAPAAPEVLMEVEKEEVARKAEAPEGLAETEARSDISVQSPAALRQLGVKGAAAEAKLKYAAVGRAELQYTIERRNPDGSYSEATPDEPFGLSEQIRLNVVPGIEGHLYIVETSTPDAPRLLFAGAASQRGRRPVPVTETLPPPESPGQRKLLLILSAQPLSLDALGVTGPLDKDATEAIVEVNLSYR